MLSISEIPISEKILLGIPHQGIIVITFMLEYERIYSTGTGWSWLVLSVKRTKMLELIDNAFARYFAKSVHNCRYTLRI